MNEFSLKELYDVKIKATYPMKIKGEEFEVGETLVEFDKLLIANFQEIRSVISARGGYDNRARVTWDDLKEVAISFSQGIFSKIQMGMFINSEIGEIKTDETILISHREQLESDEEGKVRLSKEPTGEVFFRTLEGKKIKNVIKNGGGDFNVGSPYLQLIADYEYSYNNGGTILTIGRRFMDGYLSLEGKTRVKDDITGHVHTGIIKIPRLKLMSDLSMRLGQNADPLVGTFNALAYPVGNKGDKVAIDLVILNDDIDSDM